MTPHQPTTEQRFYVLDALRGIAALIVVLWHLEPYIGAYRPLHGDLAVDIFFCMSGFVIAHAYQHKLQSDLSAGRFMLLRMIRLYPLYFLGTALGVAAALSAGDSGPASQILTAFLMLPALSEGATLPFPYNFVAWSLFFEVFINIVYAYTFPHWTRRALLIVMAICGLLFIIATPARFYGWFDWSIAALPTSILRIFFDFPAGVLLYQLYEKGRLPHAKNFYAIILAALAMMIYRPSNPDIGVIWDLATALIGVPALVAFALVAPTPEKWQKICAHLGAASYGVYILHIPLLAAVLPYIAPPNPPQSFGLAIGIFFIAFAIDRWVDTPLRKKMMRAFAQRGAPILQSALPNNAAR